MLNSKYYRTIIFFIFCIILFVSAYIAKAEGKNNVLQNQPIFKIEISAMGIRYEINVNGVSVMREYNAESQVLVELPINHLMNPINNEFQYMITPSKGESISPNSYLNVSLVIKENNDSNVLYRLPILMFDGKHLSEQSEMSKSLSSGVYSLANNKLLKDTGDIQVSDISNKRVIERIKSPTTLIYTRKIKIPSNIPLWHFFNSEKLPNYYSMSDEDYYTAVDDLFVEYKKIQDAFLSGDVSVILEMAKERNREGDLAFYNTPGEMEQSLKTAILDKLNDPAWELRIRKPSSVGITLEDNHKLVSLTLNNSGNSIGFIKPNGTYYSFPLMFRRENGKWILTR